MLSLLLWYHSQLEYRNNLRTVHLWRFYFFPFSLLFFCSLSRTLSRSFVHSLSLSLSPFLILFPLPVSPNLYIFPLDWQIRNYVAPVPVVSNAIFDHYTRVACVTAAKGCTPCAPIHHRTSAPCVPTRKNPFLASPVRGNPTEIKTKRDTGYESTDGGGTGARIHSDE